MKRSALGLAAMAAGILAGATTPMQVLSAAETAIRQANPAAKIQTGHVTPRWHVPDAFASAGTWMRLRSTRRRRSGYGWTNAHAQRVARKARNVKRHRASKKG